MWNEATEDKTRDIVTLKQEEDRSQDCIATSFRNRIKFCIDVLPSVCLSIYLKYSEVMHSTMKQITFKWPSSTIFVCSMELWNFYDRLGPGCACTVPRNRLWPSKMAMRGQFCVHSTKLYILLMSAGWGHHLFLNILLREVVIFPMLTSLIHIFVHVFQRQ